MNNPFRRAHRHDASRSAENAPDPALYARQVAALSQATEQALALQSQADVAIRACGATGTVPDDVAVEVGVMLRGYSELHHQVDELKPAPGLRGLQQELLGQLSYHVHMLRDAGDLVFSGRPAAGNERFRRELAQGLGPHAEGLVRLRDQLARLPAGSAR